METQQYTSGSGNWTVPAGVYSCNVVLVGGGGGGASGASPQAGGGGGGVLFATEVPVVPSESIAYVIGAGGAFDSDGVDTSFGNILKASGGKKGVTNTGGAGGAAMDTAGGAAVTDSPRSSAGKSYLGEVGGGGGGSGTYDNGGNSPYADGGAGDNTGGGGGASWGDGGARNVAAAVNTGGGGGGNALGGSGYILITWGIAIDISLLATEAELDKVPKSDGAVVWNSTAQATIKTQAATVLTDTNTELSALPNSTAGLRSMLQFIFQLVRNRRKLTSGIETIYKEDASTALGTASWSDDGTTSERSEFS